MSYCFKKVHVYKRVSNKNKLKYFTLVWNSPYIYAYFINFNYALNKRIQQCNLNSDRIAYGLPPLRRGRASAGGTSIQVGERDWPNQ